MVRRTELAPLAVLAVALFGLVGCGGGGGGGSTPKPPNLSFSPSSAAVTTTEGARGSFSVTGTLSQEAADSIDHVSIEDEAGLLDDLEVEVRSETVAYITFYTRSNLQPGEYSGRLSFYLCMDRDCRNTATPNPFILGYSIVVNPAPPAAVVTPTAIEGSVETGETLTVALQALIAPSLNSLNIGGFAAIDSHSRFDFTVQIVSRAGPQFALALNVRTSGAPGVYSGRVNLVVCYGSGVCTVDSQAPGSPVSIPYTITVTPETVLQPVPSASGLPEWETFQGNPEHSGYVPTTLNAAAFTHGWRWNAPSGSLARLSPVATGSGKVVVAASAGNGASPTLYALNEADGAIAWRHDFGDIHRLNHPAVSSGRVFVATSGHGDTFMWSFDVQTGARQFQIPFASQWESYLAPTIKSGYVYTNGGYYGGMYSFRGLTGTQRWFAQLQQYDLWTPAVDDAYAYAHTGYELAVVNRLTGERTLTVPNTQFNWRGYALNIAPVLPGDGSVVVVDGVYAFDESVEHNNSLIRYDIAGAAESWRVAGRFRSNPAVAAGNVYVINSVSRRLEARALSTGVLLWSWSPDDAEESFPVRNLVLTDNLIFLSSSAATYAIDLASHQTVWSTPRTGHLALSSNRILYVVDEAAGQIDAYRLAP